MGLFAMVGAAVSHVASCIGAAMGSIGGYAKSVMGIIATIPRIDTGIGLKGIIEFVCDIAHAVAKLLGVKTEDSPEELGAKAQQAEKKIEDFDGDVEEYIRYLKEEIALDQEEFNNMSDEERLACKAVGMAIETKAVEKKLGGIEIPIETVATIGKLHNAGIDVNAKDIVNVLKGMKEAGITNTNDVVEYLEGRGDSDRVKTGTVMKEILGEDSDDKISQMKDAVRQS